MAKKEQPASVSPATSPSSNNSSVSTTGSATSGTGTNHVVNAVIAANDYFTPGSVVRCVTCRDDVVEGEVMAFDPPTRFIILKCAATNRRSNLNNVAILNMEMVKDLKTIQEAKPGRRPELPCLDKERLDIRTRSNIEKKKKKAKAFKAGVSPDGHRVFQAIIKTLEDCDWNGENIVVMNKVTIAPPYKPENVKGNKDSQAFTHVKKIVEKHWDDRQTDPERANSTPNHSSSPARDSPSNAANDTPTSGRTASSSPQPAPSQQQQRQGGRGKMKGAPAARGGGGGGGPHNNTKPTYFMQ